MKRFNRHLDAPSADHESAADRVLPVAPKKQFKKSLASRGQQEALVLTMNARQQELDILCKRYLHALAQQLATRVSEDTFSDLALFIECIEEFCGVENSVTQNAPLEVEIRHNLLENKLRYATFLRDQLREISKKESQDASSQMEDEAMPSTYVKLSDTGFMLSRDTLRERLRVASAERTVELLPLLYEELRGLSNLQKIEELWSYVLMHRDTAVMQTYADLLVSEASAFVSTAEAQKSASQAQIRDIDRAIHFIESYLTTIVMHGVSTASSQLRRLAVQLYALFLRAHNLYYRYVNLHNAGKKGDRAPLSKEFAWARLEKLVDGLPAQQALSFEMLCLCEWILLSPFMAEKEIAQACKLLAESRKSSSSSTKPVAAASAADSDSDSDESDDDESDQEDALQSSPEETIRAQNIYVADLYEYMCRNVTERAQQQLTFDSTVDYLRYLLLTDEYNDKFISRGLSPLGSKYFDNTASIKMPLALSKDDSVGVRAEKVATALVKNRKLLLSMLHKYEIKELPRNQRQKEVNRKHLSRQAAAAVDAEEEQEAAQKQESDGDDMSDDE